MGNKRGRLRFFAVLVSMLFLMLPVAFAVDISGVSVDSVGSDSAIVNWETDENSDSLVSYGEDISNLENEVSSSDAVTSHSMEILGLSSETEYFFSVASSTDTGESDTDDNSGELYSFTTKASEEEEIEESSESEENEEDTESEEETDTESSEVSSASEIGLAVEIDERVGDDEIDVVGSASSGTSVSMYVNGGYFAKEEVGGEVSGDDSSDSGLGSFSFESVPITADTTNVITIEASLQTESGEVTEELSFSVYSDMTHPELVIDDVSSVTDESSIEISGTVTEYGTLSLIVNDVEQTSLEISAEGDSGLAFSLDVNLEEGANEIEIVFYDTVDFSDSVEVEVYSDTQEPTVEAELSKGNEYYQNRAQTDITGTTEAGAEVYLYVYRPLSYDFTPSFKSSDVWDVTTAETSGEFSFEDIDFENEPVSLSDLEHLEVPAGLESVTISGVSSAEAADTFTYELYIIAVDKSGKSGYYKDSVTVNTCYSVNLDFLIQDQAEYQAPLRLDPGLLDDGREEISAVFTFDYQGQGSSFDEDELPYRVREVRFEKACTQSMIDDDKFGMACAILPNDPVVLSNPEKTSHYLSWSLYATEDYSDRKDDFWDDLKSRQLVFPLQVTVSYQERDSNGDYGSSKTQTSCYDIGYFVDVPVDTGKLIPDWLADEGVEALGFTIEKIDKILPYLEKAILVTGVGCVFSFMSKIVVRIMRLTVSKTEAAASQASGDGSCPIGKGQHDLFLDSTLDGWETGSLGTLDTGTIGKLTINKIVGKYSSGGDAKKEVSLNDRCPATAGMWNLETTLEKAYRWTCDRVFCKASPAKWTETKQDHEIESVILEQNSCGVSGACVPLEPKENCRQYIKDNNVISLDGSNLDDLDLDGDTCWYYANDASVSLTNSISVGLYRNPGIDSTDSIAEANAKKGIYQLERIGKEATTGLGKSNTLLVKQEGDTFCAAQDRTCKQVCESKRGYGPVSDGYDSTNVELNAEGVCYKEAEDGSLTGFAEGSRVDGTKISAGYTKDCFVGDEIGVAGKSSFYQCVCEADDDGSTKVYTGAREAVPKDETSGAYETYSYRQDRLFSESLNTAGTYYNEKRYYRGRDFSAAFGQNYALDYLSPGNEKVVEVDPNTQHLGAFQTMCLSGIRARLVLFRNILEGLRTCIVEAKYTGFHDAGMCKTLFAQHVCGMVYKAITYFGNQCSPVSFADQGKEKSIFGEVTPLRDLSSSIEPAIQSSIDDLSDDYGNAAIDEYFSGGAQGLAQSICLVAFGYDWPLGLDFIQDAAYSVAMKTSVLITPAEREFTNYDPQSLTAVYNYNVGAVIFAGCKINSYQTSLKCVGAEDRSNPGVDTSCGGEGCDCLNAQDSSPFESEKTHLLDGGSGINAQSGELVDIQMEMPQKIKDTHYRYDHVVLEIFLDPNEDPERCFEEGIATATGGKFYTPIRDVSPSVVASCQVQIDGTYSCPAISDLFYGDSGLAYLDTPYAQCYEKRTGLWVDCDSSNLFLEGDDIDIKPYLYTDGEGYCLEVEVTGSGTEYGGTDGKEILDVPSGIAGQITPSISLGTVTEEMFGDYDNGLELDESRSNDGCPSEEAIERSISSSPSSVSSRLKATFEYEVDSSSGKYRLKEPDISSGSPEVALASSSSGSYTFNGYLKDSSSNDLFSLSEINNVVFEFEGFEFKNVLGSAGIDSPKACIYKTKAARRTSTDEATIGVEFTLLQKDSTGSCYGAEVPVTDSSLGRTSYSVSVRVQKDELEIESGEESNIYEDFVLGDYSSVVSQASRLIESGEGELNEAVGTYYYVAALVKQAVESGGTISDVSSRVEVLLNRFFLRKDSLGETIVYTYSGDTMQATEFQQSRIYLCNVATVLGIDGNYDATKSDYGCS